MIVDIDEPWSDNETAHIDPAMRLGAREVADGDDSTGLDAKVGIPRRGARAIDNLAALQHYIERRGRSRLHRKDKQQRDNAPDWQ
jgi:hypothetical protein